MLENIIIEIETPHSMSAIPYPDTSKVFNIKQLSTKEVVEWSCPFQLNSYYDT
jgi:hypothetical protein